MLLDDQDRTLWDRAQIDEGVGLVERALASRRWARTSLQAAIAAVHAEARHAADTDWAEIVGLYDVLLSCRAVAGRLAQSCRCGGRCATALPAGSARIDALLDSGALRDYRLLHAARADLCRRLGRADDARGAYQRALELTRQEPERRFLQRRLAELSQSSSSQS
ncbi:MAG: hypothetical protein QM736_18455 [Vicinamibacterales bacterium]